MDVTLGFNLWTWDHSLFCLITICLSSLRGPTPDEKDATRSMLQKRRIPPFLEASVEDWISAWPKNNKASSTQDGSLWLEDRERWVCWDGGKGNCEQNQKPSMDFSISVTKERVEENLHRETAMNVQTLNAVLRVVDNTKAHLRNSLD